MIIGMPTNEMIPDPLEFLLRPIYLDLFEAPPLHLI